MRRVLVLLGLLAALACALPVRYDGHRFVRIFTEDESVHQWLFDSFDVMRPRHGSFDVRATPAQFQLLKGLGLNMEVLVDNVQALIDQEAEARSLRRNGTWFEDYHTYEETKQWYAQLARDHPGTTFIPSIGKSHEGRDLFAFIFGTSGKPALYFQSLQHAREWISGATVNYLVWHLLNEDTSLLSEYEFVIVPVVNPDGYEHSWKSDRLWRKNRRNNGGTYGVDLNRNWNSHWGQGGSSSLPSSDTYMGPSVASEPEVQAIAKFFLARPNIIAGIDFHCYSQLLLRPYGWKRGDAEHEDQLFEAAQGMVDEIAAVHGKKFENIHSIELYVTTGTTSDWFYDDEVKATFGHRIYAYTFELRPSSPFPGFVLPPEEIIPSGEELTPAIKFFAKYAAQRPITN